MCKTKNFLAYNPIVEIEKREIATQLTKCNECQKINQFFERNKVKKKTFRLQNMDTYCKNCKKHTGFLTNCL